MHMSMDAYVDGMYNSFKEYVPQRTFKTPCEHNLLLTLSTDPISEENKRVLGRGYQSAVGVLLWASRGVFPQISRSIHRPTVVQSDEQANRARMASSNATHWMDVLPKGLRDHL